LYFRGVAPQKVDIPEVPGLSQDWKRLDTNVLGEFGLREVLKQFLDTPRAIQLAANWQGDRYGLYENTRDHRLLLAVVMRVGNPEQASQLLEGFSKAFEKKYVTRTNAKRSDNSFSFDTQDGGVFFRCSGNDCVSFEGADQQVFDKFVRALGWKPNTALAHAGRQRDAAVAAELH
jgi:hypothetical protein